MAKTAVPVETESTFVRRTHTAGSLTVREAPIASYLLAKLHKSPIPKGAKIDQKAVSTAFGVVGQFVNAIFDEARNARAGLVARAKKGDDSAKKQLEQIDKALAQMEKQKKDGNWDRITDLATAAAKKERVRKAKPAAEPGKPAKAAIKSTKTAKSGGRAEGDGRSAQKSAKSKQERRAELRKAQGKVTTPAPTAVTQPAAPTSEAAPAA